MRVPQEMTRLSAGGRPQLKRDGRPMVCVEATTQIHALNMTLRIPAPPGCSASAFLIPLVMPLNEKNNMQSDVS